jgi:hypothetical protein
MSGSQNAATTAESLLTAMLPASHVRAALKHLSGQAEEFSRGKWEESIAKGGKFIEAVLKALWVYSGEPLPPARKFSAGTTIDQLPGTKLTVDSLRLTVPRACRIIYDIASNRGGRHDPFEVDANEMDATLVMSTAQWILAELVRISQKGTAPTDEVIAIVNELTVRRYPFFENIGGRLYSDIGKGAREKAILILYAAGKRLHRGELEASIQRHGFTGANARIAVERIATLVDDDGTGGLMLRNIGRQEAERLIVEARS